MVKAKKPQVSLSIGGEEILPGQQIYLDLPIADLYTTSSLSMPVQVTRGKRAGPVLFVSAAIHGDEINGVEIVRRLLAHKSLRQLRGTLIAIPIVNVHGFLDQSRYLPDRRDLNRSFPGSSQGSVAGRLAHHFAAEIIEKSDYGIDLHTGAIHRSNLPQVRGNLSDPKTLELAREFDVPVLIDAKLRDGSLRGYAAELGIPTLLYEAGEALRFDEVGIRAGVRGVMSVMRKLGMLPPRKRSAKRLQSQIATTTSWIRSPESGIMRSHTHLGQRVEKGQLLATVGDPFGISETRIESTYAGIVIGMSRLPLAHEGDALFHVARFDSVAKAEDSIEEFHIEHDTTTI